MDIPLLTWLNTLVLVVAALIGLYETRKTSEALARVIGENNRILAEMLERIVQTTTRTEQMTARILTAVSSRGASH